MNRPIACVVVLLVVAPFCITCPAQTLTWQSSRSNALALASREGKLVLLLAGRPTCANCNYMQYTVCESTDPPIQGLIQDRFVPWFSDLDQSSEWADYAIGLVSFVPPMICCIAPDRPGAYLNRTTGIQNPPAFHTRLENQPWAVLTKARLTDLSISDGVASISLSNLTAWATNRVERCLDLSSTPEWSEVWTRVSTTMTTNWSEPITNSWSRAFYRVTSEK